MAGIGQIEHGLVRGIRGLSNGYPVARVVARQRLIVSSRFGLRRESVATLLNESKIHGSV
jgi:hypothetical protein